MVYKMFPGNVNIYCSQLVRTAETAIVLFSHNNNLTLNIIPYISEKRTWTGTNKDNEPTNIKTYVIKVHKFFKKFIKNENVNIKKIKLVFYNNDYDKIVNYTIPYNKEHINNSYDFILKPHKKKFINLFSEKCIGVNSSPNIIVTHSKFFKNLIQIIKK